MAMKRNICEEKEIEEGEVERFKEDRVSKLPDDLKLHILSFLDTPDAINTTILSKTWVSFWNRIPVLGFNLFEYYNNFNNNVVYQKLKFSTCNHPSPKLERLTFTRGRSIDKNNVSKKEEWRIHITSNHTWPLCLNTSYETSLTSLELQSNKSIRFLLGPRSGSFKNLTHLFLRRVIITDPDPFSGFPVLESLRLINCDISTEPKRKTLHIHALNLSDLTIRAYQKNFDYCQLTTPRLRYFLQVCDVRITHKGLISVLDGMSISCDSNPPYNNNNKKKSFDNLFSLFCTFNNIRFLTLSHSTIQLLYSFPEELVKRNSPLHNLKRLKLFFKNDFDRRLSSSKMVADVKAYFIQNAPYAEVTIRHL